jgi:predicted DNA-binding ribbon-helix-helix protein
MPILRRTVQTDASDHPLLAGIDLTQKSSIRNVQLGSQRTSMRMEPDFWQALEAIASMEQKTVNAVVAEIDRKRGRSGLSASVRVFIVKYFRVRARNA